MIAYETSPASGVRDMRQYVSMIPEVWRWGPCARIKSDTRIKPQACSLLSDIHPDKHRITVIPPASLVDKGRHPLETSLAKTHVRCMIFLLL